MSTLWTSTIPTVVSSYPYDSSLKASATTYKGPQQSAAGATTPGAALPGAGVTSGLPGAAATAAGAGIPGLAGTPGGTGSVNDQFAAYFQMQKESQQFNLAYLQLQESMQQENRSFSALSNVLKARHETMRSSISNIK